MSYAVVVFLVVYCSTATDPVYNYPSDPHVHGSLVINPTLGVTKTKNKIV